MPTYQYRCTECDSSLEVVQRFSDEPLTVCPECSGRLRKVFSPVGVVFKGSGFYKTDSRSTGARKGSGPGSDAPKSGASADGSAEAPAKAAAPDAKQDGKREGKQDGKAAGTATPAKAGKDSVSSGT